MQVKKKKLTDLIPADYNPRKDLQPGDAEYEKLKRSIETFGYVEPIIWNKQTGRIVGGHQRLKVMQDLGYQEIECVIIDIDESKEKALNVALNKISGSWDEDKLMSLITDLEGSDFDVSLTGFDIAELDELFKDSLTDGIEDYNFDVKEELKKPAMSKLGDVWTLGKHRLLVGDSTKIETYERLMKDKQANLVVTDPPYNVDYEGAAGKIKNDKMENQAFYEFLLVAFTQMEKVMTNEASIYVFHADTEGFNFRRAFQEAGFYLSGTCIWKKESLVLGRSPYQWQHEPILFGWKKKGKHLWYSGRKETTIWEYDKPKRNTDHPTMKPIPLLSYPIMNSSTSNAIVLDPFGGSGSTLMACEQTNRICYTIELDEKFADVIIKRYIELIGKSDEVSVERDGVSFLFTEIEGLQDD
ncbi:site-specific DNA-methyltransferase [Facklamia hominis]